MILASHQPNYLPNLAFFSKMRQADKFIIITNVQFEKGEGWQQRHKITGAQGDIWLTVPVFGTQNQLLRDVKINNNIPWRRKHQKTLYLLFHKSKGAYLLPEFTKIYERSWDRLVDLNFALIKLIASILEIKTPIVLDEEVSGKKQELLINICKKYNANKYLSGVGAKLYMNEDYLKKLKSNNIEHKIVARNLTAEFPYSTVHYLLSEGLEWVTSLTWPFLIDSGTSAL